MIIVGGGLGGLLSAALFSRERKVTVFERSRQLGGRFRNFDREGYALTTGALHMLPHGSKGPLAEILATVGARCQIVDSNPYATFLINGQEMRFHDVRKSLSHTDRLRISKLLLQMRYMNVPDISVEEYMTARFSDPIFMKFLKCFLGWSLSLPPNELGMRDFSEIIRNFLKYGGPGIPMGGCGGVVSALTDVLKANDVEVIHRKVGSLIIEGGSVRGIETTDGDEYYDDIVISDIGAKATCDLCPGNTLEKTFLGKVGCIRPSGGIKINFSSDEPLISHNGIFFPMDCERVEGIVEVTNVDPSLAPKGKHLLMSHQTLGPGSITSEVKKGISDIEETFKGRDIDIICAQSYFGKNPVNHASQGEDLRVDSFPIGGLYVVGDSVKGAGGIEVDGVALGVLDLYSKLAKA
ncbi:MAG TPA: NAD(P)-binding protein [Candidatus Methanofastidiosa archaeon]|nr:NAD(P)-binding protein [Candidatus Methanofastidiosa archaeon]